MTFHISLADANLVESLHEFTRYAAGGTILERDGMAFNFAADPFPGINDVMRTGPGPTPGAQAFLQRAAEAFAQHDRQAFSIRARAHLDADLIEACTARGMFLVGASPGMVIHAPVGELQVPESAKGISLRVADTEAAMRDFAQVCTASYATIGLPEATGRSMFATPERMLGRHVQIVVAYDGDTPVGGALALLSHGIGGIYWVGTAPEARKRGIAPLCTRAVTNFCFESGVRSVILQASKQGEPIYRALGFEAFTRYPWFIGSVGQALTT